MCIILSKILIYNKFNFYILLDTQFEKRLNTFLRKKIQMQIDFFKLYIY